jgi:membrane protein
MNEAVARRIEEHRAGEQARGRDAAGPHHIPWLGWKDILFRLWSEVSEDRVGTVAAGTTFFLLLAIFPALAALVSLYGLVADPGTIGGHLATMNGYVPGSVIDLLGQELQRLNDNRSTTLSLGFGTGILIALWSANNGIRALFDALNVAYDETEKRSFIKLRLVSLCFTLGSIAFSVILLNVVVGVPLVLKYLHLGPVGDLLLTVLPALLLFGMSLGGLATLYRFGPSRVVAKWRWITPGSIFAAIVWLAFSVLFSWYLSSWTDYSATYGSLGAIIGVMMWIYLSLWVVLVGAELNAEIEHQTAQDTTVGPDRPLGSRGAFMADHVGRSQA